MGEYYKFHIEIPRTFMKTVCDIVNSNLKIYRLS